MILKMMLGKGARGLLSYISKAEKTGSARPFFSNMAGTNPRELSAEVAALRKLRPNLNRAVGHLVLSSDPKDRKLSDEEWRQAITTALKTHGAEQAAFAAYRHADTTHDHTHVFFCECCRMGSSYRTATTTEKTKSPHGKLKWSSN